MEVTSPQATAVAQAPSVMGTASAPSSVAPSGMSQPSPSQVSAPTYQQQTTPQAPTYQQAPAQQGSAAGNPWQEAFQALSHSLNTPNLSPAPVQYSAYQTPTPQAASQASWGSMEQQAPSYHSGNQTYNPQASTQAFSQDQVQQLVHQAQQQGYAHAQSQGQAQDAYLSQVSDESLEVLQHFGAEAPALLNTYACAVEDALIEQVGRGNNQNLMLEVAGEERAAMNLMLTNPDVLADYVNGFFGPEGPYPTETDDETYAREEAEARGRFEAEIQAQEQNLVPPNFQRPVMDMPTPGRQAQSNTQAFWGDFSEMMDSSPEQAWQYLSSAPRGALQSKLLVQDT